MLAVLLRMERESGVRQWLPVVAVLNSMWNVELRPEREARHAQAVRREAEWQADTKQKTIAGDADAIEKLNACAVLQRLDRMLIGRRAPQRVRDDGGSLEREMNPSRVFRLLRARGLIERAASASGPGSYLRLTDAGQAAAISVGSLRSEAAGVEFLAENGGGAGVRLRKPLGDILDTPIEGDA